MTAAQVPAEVLAAVERGWSVIPCGDNKRPLVRSWKANQEKPADLAQIEQWAKQQPASWAVVTGAVSGVIVLDFDGDDGRSLLERYDLPIHVRTGSGGAHVYVAHTGRKVATLNGKAKHELGRRFPGLDIRGDGGYACFSGRNGAGPYEQLNPEPLVFAALPAELRALLEGKPTPIEQGEPPSAEMLLSWALDRASVGTRNETGFQLACQLRDNGHDQRQAERTLCEYAARAPGGDEPYTEAEALASVRQAYRTAAREPWNGEAKSLGQASSNGARPREYKVTWDTSGKGTPKLVLPPKPQAADVAGQCAWLTCVFNLDPAHPITGGKREGLAGPDGHAVLHRAGAPPLRFEPIRRLSTPAKLAEDLEGWNQPFDGEVYGYTTEHARKVHHVVRMLCGVAGTRTAEDETAAIIGTFLRGADAIEGHTTCGTSGQRYEAATALRETRDRAPHYLIDLNTGELVICVSDLMFAARRYIGGSVPRGWLDARMAGLGWDRRQLQGFALPGRASAPDGRRGPHARVDVYRGHLPAEVDGEVNT
jgi:hypothetical protein